MSNISARREILAFMVRSQKETQSTEVKQLLKKAMNAWMQIDYEECLTNICEAAIVEAGILKEEPKEWTV